MAGFLFSQPQGSPMLRNEFDVSSKRILSFCGYQSSSLKAIIYAFGASTAAALRCESVASKGRLGIGHPMRFENISVLPNRSKPNGDVAVGWSQ